MPVHYSGLPFIRVKTVDLVRGELPMFVGLAVGVTAPAAALLLVVAGDVDEPGGGERERDLVLRHHRDPGYKLTMLTSVILPLST